MDNEEFDEEFDEEFNDKQPYTNIHMEFNDNTLKREVLMELITRPDTSFNVELICHHVIQWLAKNARPISHGLIKDFSLWKNNLEGKDAIYYGIIYALEEKDRLNATYSFVFKKQYNEGLSRWSDEYHLYKFINDDYWFHERDIDFIDNLLRNIYIVNAVPRTLKKAEET